MAESSGNIVWGTMIAGAAVATGAVILAPAILGPEIAKEGIVASIGKGIEALTSWVGGLLTPSATATASTAPSLLSTMLDNPATKNIAGAALLGGGGAYFLGGGGAARGEAPDPDAILAAQEQDSFAGREDMKKRQALMVARMSAQTPGVIPGGMSPA